MTAVVLDGRSIAKQVREELRNRVQALVARRGSAPALAVVQVLGDSAADRYVRALRRMCDDLGISSRLYALAANSSQYELNQQLEQLSKAPDIDGILLQIPLPADLNQQEATRLIDPHKDIDGVTEQSAGALVLGHATFVPGTPAGGMELLRRYNIPIKGRRAVVVGRSTIVGKPMALLLLQEHATVTVAHSRTIDLAAVVREAEIVVAAVGKPGLITADMVRPGATVIDFGINVLDDGSLVGDLDYDSVVEVAGAVTPVPGGTGPMTNCMVLRNLLDAAEGRLGAA